MADVDNNPQQPETLGTVGNEDMPDDEAATNPPQNDEDDATNKTDSDEKDQAASQDNDEKMTAEGDDSNAATIGDDHKPPEDSAAPEPSATLGEAGGISDQGPSKEEGGVEDKTQSGEEAETTAEGKQDEDDAQRGAGAGDEQAEVGEGGGGEQGNKEPGEGGGGEQGNKEPEEGGEADPQTNKDATAAPPQDTQQQQQQDEEEIDQDQHQHPPTPTFSSDPERDEDDTARSQAAAALEKAVEGSEDNPTTDSVTESTIAAITAAGGASEDAAAAASEHPGLLMSARTPVTSDGLIATSTTIKRLTNTPLGGAGPPAKPRTSQLPPVARGRVRGQQMTSSISDALQYVGQPSPKMLIRSRRPPKYIRLATVTVSPARSRPLPHGPSLYYEEPKRPKKVITWDEANNARPPLRIDMEGPTACSYTPRVKPLNETNAPSFTFGSKCVPEKSGGARTSWTKSWFQTPHVWHTKVDFTRDNNWPSPNHYPKTSGLGPRQRTMPEAPSYTFGHKSAFSIIKPGANKEPSPNEYKRQTADKIVLPQGPSFTHQLRREGTTLWGSTEVTPGPAAYSPGKPSTDRPSFTIQGIRREKSHFLGPYSAL